MALGGTQPVRHGRSLKLPSLLVLLWIFRRAEKGTDCDRPEIVSTNTKSKPVLDLAKRLADEGREDPGAVAELRESARNRRRTLRQAERASRLMGYHRELSRSNLTNRLLKAAVAREPVPSPRTTLDNAQIEAVESFNRLAGGQQWAQLTQLQPALLDVETDVRTGRFGDIAIRDYGLLSHRTSVHESADGERRRTVTLSSSDPPLTEEQMETLRQSGNGRTELMTRLRLLAGPRSGTDNQLLKSQRALDVANAHMLRAQSEKAARPPGPSDMH